MFVHSSEFEIYENSAEWTNIEIETFANFGQLASMSSVFLHLFGPGWAEAIFCWIRFNKKRKTISWTGIASSFDFNSAEIRIPREGNNLIKLKRQSNETSKCGKWRALNWLRNIESKVLQKNQITIGRFSSQCYHLNFNS